MLSIEKRSEMISNADKNVFNLTSVEPEDNDEQETMEVKHIEAVEKKKTQKIEVVKSKEIADRQKSKPVSEVKSKGK